MRGLIGPVGEWLALPPSTQHPMPGWNTVIPGDVFAVVEPTYMHNRIGPDFGKQRYKVTGFVRVDEVLQLEPLLSPSTAPSDVVNALADLHELLPDAVPGGIALRLAPYACPTCGGFRSVQGDVEGVSMALACPTCTGPVTVTGDGPIVDVTP
jgi:hypothetical protein